MSATTTSHTARMEETEVLIRLFAFEVARIDLIAASVGLTPDELAQCWIRTCMRDAGRMFPPGHVARGEVAPC